MPACSDLPIQALRGRDCWSEMRITTSALLSLADNAPSLLYAVDLKGKIQFANRAVGLVTGVAPAEMIGRRRDEVMPAKVAAEHEESDRRALALDGAFNVTEEFEVEGRVRTFVTTKVPWRDDEGQVIGVVGISTETTELEDYGGRLRASEAAHRRLFEQNPQPMWVYDLETLRFLAVNDAAVQSYGYSRAEFLAMTLEDIRPEEDLERLREDLRQPQARLNLAGEWRHRTRDGQILDVEIRSHEVVWEGRAARMVVAFDVTARKRATAELDQFFSLSQDLLCISGLDGTLLRVNPQWELTLGYGVEELVGKNHRDVIAATDADKAPLPAAGSLSVVSRYRCKDGGTRTLEWQARASGGKVYAVGRDITERLTAEARLRDLSRAVEQSPAVVMITDVEGHIEYVNPKFEAVTGYTSGEVLGKTPRILKSGQTAEEEYRRLWTVILSGREWEGEFQNRRKDGSLYVERASISPVRDEAGKIRHFVAVKEDVTEKRALEQQLAQAGRMEAIGQLAGGVAHDFNNLLTVINGYAELLEGSPQLEGKAKEHVGRIRRAGDRAASLTGQLLAFSRRQVSQPRVVNLAAEIGEFEHLVRPVLPENITLELVLCEEETQVMADPTQIHQVLMNLALNGRDAMVEGGLLTIETRVVTEAAVRGASAAGERVELIVRDTGQGMTEEVKQRIFEPFFSTKAPGKGTGLGLSTVYGIVRQSSGKIDVASAPGKGTEFRVSLPRVVGEAREASKNGEPGAFPGEERVLLVEDYEETQQFAVDLLRSLGYTVTAAKSAEEALIALDENEDGFDVLLTDVALPGLSGPRLAEIFRARFPFGAVVLMSGSDQAREEAEAGAVLMKPFTPDGLARRLRQAIRGANERCNVLLVDDDAEILSLMRGILSDAGYEVRTATDGNEALEAAQQRPPQLVLMDLVMPGKEGLETIGPMRKLHAALPIIAMSGGFGGHFLHVARLLGARTTLQKPVPKGVLLETVRHVLRHLRG